MPQRKTPLRRSERIKKKMDTINEIVNEKEKVLEPTPQGNEMLNIFKISSDYKFCSSLRNRGEDTRNAGISSLIHTIPNVISIIK